MGLLTRHIVCRHVGGMPARGCRSGMVPKMRVSQSVVRSSKEQSLLAASVNQILDRYDDVEQSSKFIISWISLLSCPAP